MGNKNEDQRTAVSFSVGLSGQLIQAAVTLLTIQGAYVAYALPSRCTGQMFELLAFSAASLLVMSIVCAGRAVTKARNAGYKGRWSLDMGKQDFNSQAILLALSLVLLFLMLLDSGSPKESDLSKKLESLEKRLEQSEAVRQKIASRLDEYVSATGKQLNQLSNDNAMLRTEMKTHKH